MICLKTFKRRVSSDFNSWNEWVDFVNENYKFAETQSTIDDYIGKCKESDLPSYHPYWVNFVRNEKIKLLEKLKTNIEVCSKNHSLIKYFFNKTTSIQDIIDKYNKLKNELTY